MSESKIIVLQGCSTESWEDAVRNVVKKVSESMTDMQRVDIVHQSARVSEGEIVEFRVTVHVVLGEN